MSQFRVWNVSGFTCFSVNGNRKPQNRKFVPMHSDSIQTVVFRSSHSIHLDQHFKLDKSAILLHIWRQNYTTTINNNKTIRYIGDKNDSRLLYAPILVATTLLTHIKENKKTKNCQNEQRQSPKKRRRVCRSVEAIYKEVESIYFWRAYRMKHESFIKLVDLLLPFLPSTDSLMARDNGSITNLFQ